MSKLMVKLPREEFARRRLSQLTKNSMRGPPRHRMLAAPPNSAHANLLISSGAIVTTFDHNFQQIIYECLRNYSGPCHRAAFSQSAERSQATAVRRWARFRYCRFSIKLTTNDGIFLQLHFIVVIIFSRMSHEDISRSLAPGQPWRGRSRTNARAAIPSTAVPEINT
jgi:hypothetical protein